MAMFMQVRERKVYGERREVVGKQLLRFEDESVNFLVNEFLPYTEDTRGEALTSREKNGDISTFSCQSRIPKWSC